MARDFENTDKHETGAGNDVHAALAAGAALGGPQSPVQEPGAGVYAVVPKGYSLESLEGYLPRPLRIEQCILLHDTDSFIGYLNEYAKQGISLIFFNVEGEEFVAILDYHEKPETPGWCDHVAKFHPRRQRRVHHVDGFQPQADDAG